MANAAQDAPLRDALAVGNAVPPAFGMDSGRVFYASAEQYGRPAVLILAGCQVAAERIAPVLGTLARHETAFADRQTDCLLMLDDNPCRMTPILAAPVRAIDCGDFLSRCGIGPVDLRVVVHDRNLRIAWSGQCEPVEDIVRHCLAALDRLPREAARDIAAPAPILVLPNLLTVAMCRDLIAAFETGEATEGGVARVDAQGRATNVVDPVKKRRRDLVIDPGSDLHQTLSETLLRRCRPEIAKAFRAQVAFTDRILVARYDDTGGWFRRHRDNEAENVAFREFALSVNLNTGDYQGGNLIFPEYNDHRYSAPAGAGMIFATSVLHEATPVLSGSRYVLLTFFHGEAAERQRRVQEARAIRALTDRPA